jgi:predicted amidophosphoribosyltransferase
MLAAIADALAVLLPVECAGCGAPDRSVCALCTALLGGTPIRMTLHGIPVVCSVRYTGAVRQLVLALKEHGRTDVVRALAASLTRVLPAGVELALVPTSDAARRRRGYDPVRVLLSATGRRGARVLTMARRAADQKELGVEQRAVNRQGAMRARGALDGRTFVIVDDVVTSGATIGEAARAIRAAGGQVDGAVALAFTPRNREGSH